MTTSLLEHAPHAAPIDRIGSLEPVDDEVRGRLQACLEELLTNNRPVQVLDAGCGKRLVVPVADDTYVVGIDIDAAQLRPDLDEALVGDLQTYDLGRERFDAIICWYVLEHIADPVVVVEKFVAALRPGGLLVLAVPHVASVKGLVTKYTPQWFHDWMWSRAFGAGPQHEAFPTVLSRSLTPKALRRQAAANGLSVAFLAEFEAWPQKRIRRKLRLKGGPFKALASLVRFASLGTVTIAYTDMVMVMHKPE
jgi:SAM-dependent methyltransferase